MICYDIVNPSDACTFLAPDAQIAVAVLAFLGEGSYAGTAVARNGERISETDANSLKVPLFLSITRPTYVEWWRENGWTECPIAAAMRDRKAEVIAALRSCAYGDLEDRATYDAACAAITDPDKLAEFKRGHEDRRRSSMNAIVKRAWAWADKLEKYEA